MTCDAGKLDNISCTNNVRNEALILRVKEERNIQHTLQKRKVNWIGLVLRVKCLLKHVITGTIEGRIDVMGRRERGRKQLLDDLQERRGFRKLKGDVLDCTVWRSRFGRGRKKRYGMNE
jgi:hypothetical protein